MDAKREKEIHRQIEQELNRRQIVFWHARMDRRSTIKKGLPDFSFALNGRPVAIEVKMPGEDLKKEQTEVRQQLLANGWSYSVVSSLQEALTVIREPNSLVDQAERLLNKISAGPSSSRHGE